MATELNCNFHNGIYLNYTHTRQIDGVISFTSLDDKENFIETDIEIYLNNVKQPSPNIIKENGTENVIFTSIIYINYGYNHVEVKYKNLSQSCDYILKYTKDELNSKDYLLYNFVENDYENIDLVMGDAKLNYLNENAGNDKEISIDTDNNLKFFKLLGENAKYYRLNTNELPQKIVSDIIARPLSVTFTKNIEKTYDGDNFVTKLVHDLIFNENGKYVFEKNHYFKDIHHDKYDYNNTGFLKGSSKILNNKTIIYKAGDKISSDDEFEVKNNNVNLENFTLFIDNIEANVNLTSHTVSEPEIIPINEDEITEEDFEKLIITNDIYNFELKEPINLNELHNLNENEIDTSNKELINIFKENKIKYEIDLNTYNTLIELIDEIQIRQEKIIEHRKIQEYVEENDVYVYKDIFTDVDRNEIKTFIKFIFKTPKKSFQYNVLDSVIIKYNYRLLNENSSINTKSDLGKVELDFDTAWFETKNVTSENQLVTINNLEFIGENANNYQIAGYSLVGKINPRKVNVGIKCLSKIYDGNNIVPISLISGVLSINNLEYVNGINNKIENDDLYISIANNDNIKDVNNHFELLVDNTYCVYLDKNVTRNENKNIINKNIQIANIQLEGNDKNNYYFDKNEVYIDNSEAIILPREISLNIDKVILNSNTGEFKISYHFENDIPTDNLSIDVSKIKIYGGKTYNTNENIYNNPDDINSNSSDIFTMFFNYSTSNNVEWIETNDPNTNMVDIISIDKKDNNDNIINSTKTLWYKDEKRSAIAKTLIRKISISENNKNISFHDDLGYAFYESKNKEYKLYNGCEVIIKDVYLSENNDNNDNYIFTKHDYGKYNSNDNESIIIEII